MKTLRIWFGCSFGLALSMLFGWSYGFMAIMLPLFVLSKTDHFHLPMMIMILLSVVWTTISTTLIWQYLHHYPALLTVAVGIVMLANCIAMTKELTFIFGFMGVLVGSLILNIGSYPMMDIEELNITMWVISVANIGICAVAHWLFPEPENNSLESTIAEPEVSEAEVIEPEKTDLERMHQVALVWAMTMLTFIFFQVADLNDSASAHASIFIILMPMTFLGAMALAKVRVIGTALGCLAGLAVQLTLGLWFEIGLLFWLLLTIAMGPFCHWLTQGVAKSAIAFSAMAALTVPLTTALSPGKSDAFFAILYRFSSIFVAVLIAVLLICIVQAWLDKRLGQVSRES